MEKDVATELFLIRTRGMVARMFDMRGVKPTATQLGMMRGTIELTVRDLAVIAHQLDCSVDMMTMPRQVEEPEDD